MKRRKYSAGGALPTDLMLALASGTDALNQSKSGRVSGVASGFSGIAKGAAAGAALGPYGAIAGGLIGGITGVINAEKNNRAIDIQDRNRNLLTRKLTEETNRATLSTYPTQGLANTSYYAAGGLLPVSKNTQLVVGDTHEMDSDGDGQTGVPIGSSEVEGGEFKKGNKIYSNRLLSSTGRSYAQEALLVATTKEYQKLEKLREKHTTALDNPAIPKYAKNTSLRTLQTNPDPLELLFEEQEGLKTAMATPSKQMADGGYLFEDDTNAYLFKDNQYLKAPIGTNPYDTSSWAAFEPDDNFRSTYLAEDNTPYFTNKGYKEVPDNFKGMYSSKPVFDIAVPNQVGGPLPSNTFSYPLNPVTSNTPGRDITANIRSSAGATNIMPGEKPAGKDWLGQANAAAGKLTPYLDNIVNAGLTARTPAIPAPILTQAPRLNTRVDINAELADINRTTAARNKTILANTKGSAIARSNLAALSANDIVNKNKIYENQRNQERGLQNQQAVTDYQASLANAGLINDYNYKTMLRKDDIDNRKSANVAQFVEDRQMAEYQKNMSVRDKQALSLVLLKYADSGVLSRAKIKQILEDIANGKPINEI
jgi:hypothetical protein